MTNTEINIKTDKEKTHLTYATNSVNFDFNSLLKINSLVALGLALVLKHGAMLIRFKAAANFVWQEIRFISVRAINPCQNQSNSDGSFKNY